MKLWKASRLADNHGTANGSGAAQAATPWHALDLEQIVALLSTDADHGLSKAESEARLAEYGPNIITAAKGPSWFRRLAAQLNQALVLILIAAGAVTAALKEWVDAGVIFGVVIINAIVGYLQESKAVKAIEALSRAITIEATVVREGQRFRLPAAQLVPGDLVVLQAGDKVPADIRLTYSRDLRVDESALTGESLPVDKQLTPLSEDTPLADRTNMVYATTLVTAGQGEGIVVATGDRTEVGRISQLIASAHEIKTPLTRKIAQFSKLVLYAILALAVVTFIIGVVRGQPWVDMFIAAVALAVGAIPEGLPAAVTITLAIGVSRMARRRAIIRKLPAVETLGSTTVICTDKTGTLTQNQMTVVQIVTPGTPDKPKIYHVTGSGYSPEGQIIEQALESLGTAAAQSSTDSSPARNLALEETIRAGALCNDASLYLEEGSWRISGDPTEGALLVAACKAGMCQEDLLHQTPRVDTLPFESQHQYMATLHRFAHSPDTRVAYIKGAVEKVVARCAWQMTPDGSLTAFLDSEKSAVEHLTAQMAREGLRVLAFARKDLPAYTEEITHREVDDGLVFLGLQAMIDPPRQEAKEAIRTCHTAGIHVKMITGDHALTAAAIARILGLHDPRCATPTEIKVATGADLATLTDEELAKVADETYVFARVTPEQKLRLVTALQSQDHVVAMTGDGVNDGPALRQADIGIAMGIAGTEVAKEAADMILTDDNFATIEAAVEEGRGVFDNLKKFITWTLPTNLGEGLVIMAAIFAGVALPILPVQILWINMTTAVLLGLGLAFESKEPGIMERAPRDPKAPILDRVLVGRIVIVGALLLAAAFGLYEYAERTGHSLAEARTVANNVFVFGELFYLFNCRSLSLASWRTGLRGNRVLVGGVAVMIGLQLLYTYLPAMNTLFQTAPLPVKTWARILAASFAIHLIIEAEKAVRRRLGQNRRSPAAC
ncbi:MAG: cation-transporting P-type ATPase [Thermoleophilia bacterium]|nr:cation-transporting P-type ATPase [Thermoleophilia bacterium]